MPKLTTLILLALALTLRADDVPPDTLLFDFESPADLAAWKPIKLPDVKEDQPAPKIHLSTDNPTSGKSALAITFAGGQWPTIATTTIPVKGTWKEFQTIKADLTLEQGGIAYLAIGQAAGDAKNAQPDWAKTLILRPGKNQVVLSIRHGLGRTILDPARGEVTSFIIGMFQPGPGQTLFIDNVRLSRDWPEPKVTGWNSPYNHDGYSAFAAADYQKTKTLPLFTVAGTDLKVSSLEELSKRLKPNFVAPPEKTTPQIEAEFKAQYDELKKTHPAAVLAIFRQGQPNYDPAHPDNIYAGWKNNYLNCHGPDGPNPGREAAPGIKYDTVEAFMRHRSVLLQADFTSIPKSAKILAARLLINRVTPPPSEMKPVKPNLWVAEPCNRDWDENSANCYYYAKDKPWKAVSGMYYGEDPDFHPIFLTHAPAAGPCNSWDFTNALKWWTEEHHENHGFFLYGDSGDYLRMYTKSAKEIPLRPAIMVIYLEK